MTEETLVYVGTYTHDFAQGMRGKSEGIYVYCLDPSSGALEFRSKAIGVENPSFLAIDPQGHNLFAVNEVGEFEGKPSGTVSSFSIDLHTGQLTYLNKQSSLGAVPCHLSVDKRGGFVLVANYGGGSVSVLPILEGGRLGEATDFVQHQGSSIHPQRQEGPHAHSIVLDPANRFAFVPDLGLDKIMVYRFDPTRGRLTPNDVPWAQTKPGAGPRHFTFHPNGKCAYLINEIDSTLTSYIYDNTRGTLRELHTVPTLPEGFVGRSSCADVHVHPSGKFVYGSNRGHDSIVIYGIDEHTGGLSYIGHELTQGRTPRNFAIDPTGNFLLAANQNTDNIVTFRVDHQTGKLASTSNVAVVPKPVCLKMIPSSS